MILLRFVSVDDDTEIALAVLADDGTVDYSGGETAQAVVTRTAADRDVSPAQAVELLAREGWSNGYIMIDLV